VTTLSSFPGQWKPETEVQHANWSLHIWPRTSAFSALSLRPVQLHPDLMNWLSKQRPDLAPVLRSSGGLNFGTKLLTDVSIWPVGRSIPDGFERCRMNGTTRIWDESRRISEAFGTMQPNSSGKFWRSSHDSLQL